MSRLRASLSNSPLDQVIQSQVATAERAIQVALRALQEVRHKEDPAHPQAHVARVRRDLERAMGALSNVRRVSPPYVSDPDFLPTAPYVRPGEAPIQQAVEPPIEEAE